jgi:hypothetical protein
LRPTFTISAFQSDAPCVVRVFKYNRFNPGCKPPVPN